MACAFQSLPRRCLRLILLAPLAAGSGCEREVAAPALGFTYNWGDSLLEHFVQAELDRSRPRGGDSIRLLASREGGWAALGSTPLIAEVARASRLAADREVLAVIGPGGSREALQVARIYAEAGVANLVPTATSRLLAGAGGSTLLLAPNDSLQGEFIATFADSALGARRLAVFYVPDEYGIGLAAGTAAAAAARGLTVLVRTPIRLVQPCDGLPEGARYYADLIAEADPRGVPDAVVIAARTQEASCLTKAARARWPRTQILGGDGVYLDASFFRTAGEAAQGVHLVAFWHPSRPERASREFAARFQAAAGRPARHGEAVFVDATLLAATAIREGGASRAAVSRYLRSLGVSRPPYDGITGPVSFAAGARRPLWMTQIRGDSSVLLEPPR